MQTERKLAPAKDFLIRAFIFLGGVAVVVLEYLDITQGH